MAKLQVAHTQHAKSSTNPCSNKRTIEFDVMTCGSTNRRSSQCVATTIVGCFMGHNHPVRDVVVFRHSIRHFRGVEHTCVCARVYYRCIHVLTVVPMWVHARKVRRSRQFCIDNQEPVMTDQPFILAGPISVVNVTLSIGMSIGHPWSRSVLSCTYR